MELSKVFKKKQPKKMSKKYLNNIKNTDISLPEEMVKIIEAGIEKQLSQSIFYSPFRLFLRLFKSKNPQLVQRVRNILKQDIELIFLENNNFKVEDFVQNNILTNEGRLLIKRGYNIGIRVVKKLTVKMLFRVMRDQEMQQKIYNYILTQVRQKTIAILQDL